MTRHPSPAAGAEKSRSRRRPRGSVDEHLSDKPPMPRPTPQETARKTIHIAAAVVATGITWRAPHRVAVAVIAGAALLALTIELARMYVPLIRRAFYRAFGFMLRPHEAHRLTGATTLAVGFAAAVLLFPPHIAAIGLLYAGIGDAAAAIIGRRWGRHRTARGKSLEGSAAFFVTAVLAGWAAPAIGVLPAVLAAFATTLLETASPPIDDNLYLPVVAAAAAWAAVGLVG